MKQDPRRTAHRRTITARSPAPRSGLRLITYLAPGLPLDLFETVAEYLGESLGLSATLESESRVSAPSREEPDPFSNDRADIGFMCAPGFYWLSERQPPAVQLVPAGFQFDDPRTQGRPVYWHRALRHQGVRRFVPVSEADMEDERRVFRTCFSPEKLSAHMHA